MYEDRIKKVQKALKTQKLDAIALFLGVNYYYFTGLVKNPSERLLTTVIPATGEPFTVSPAFEVDLVKAHTEAPIKEIIPWEEHENPFTAVAKGLKSRGIDDGVIGLDGRFEYRFAYNIQKAAPKAKFELADEVISGMRMAKSREELDYMRKACAAITKGMKAAFESVAAGRTELECSAPIHQEMRKHGISTRGFGGLRSGYVTALPHGTSSDKKIQRGEMILIDTGGTYKGYYGDLTRMAVLGKPSDKMKKVYNIVLKAQLVAIAKSAPNTEAQVLDNTARKIITDAGYGKYFTHRVGHGLGLEVHEEPYLVKGNTQKLKPGMAHSVEPGIYLLDEWGVRIEDQVAVTEKGHEVLSEGLFPTEDLMVLG